MELIDLEMCKQFDGALMESTLLLEITKAPSRSLRGILRKIFGIVLLIINLLSKGEFGILHGPPILRILWLLVKKAKE